MRRKGDREDDWKRLGDRGNDLRRKGDGGDAFRRIRNRGDNLSPGGSKDLDRDFGEAERRMREEGLQERRPDRRRDARDRGRRMERTDVDSPRYGADPHYDDWGENMAVDSIDTIHPEVGSRLIERRDDFVDRFDDREHETWGDESPYMMDEQFDRMPIEDRLVDDREYLTEQERMSDLRDGHILEYQQDHFDDIIDERSGVRREVGRVRRDVRMEMRTERRIESRRGNRSEIRRESRMEGRRVDRIEGRMESSRREERVRDFLDERIEEPFNESITERLMGMSRNLSPGRDVREDLHREDDIR